MSTRRYIVGECVHYEPHYPGNLWPLGLWWIVEVRDIQRWGRLPIVDYGVAKVSDPHARGVIDYYVRADQLSPAQAPEGFHGDPHG